MSKTITIDVLRKVADDSISIYDAFKRAHTLTEESKRILSMAEALLRLAGLVYVPEIPPSKSASVGNSSSARDEMIVAYIAIRQSYADLGDALYRLAKAHTEAQAWDKAHAIMAALLKIDPQYRDVAEMLKQSLLDQAKDLFGQGKWAEGRAILKQRPNDKGMRLAYLFSFLDEPRVDALLEEEPQIGRLPSYQQMRNLEGICLAAQHEYYRLDPFNIQNDIDKKLRDDAMANWQNVAYNLDIALQTLRAELSSMI